MCIVLFHIVKNVHLNQHAEHVNFKPPCFELDVISTAGLYSSECQNVNLEFVSSSWFRGLCYPSANATIEIPHETR
jgi:hypothetical protein